MLLHSDTIGFVSWVIPCCGGCLHIIRWPTAFLVCTSSVPAAGTDQWGGDSSTHCYSVNPVVLNYLSSSTSTCVLASTTPMNLLLKLVPVTTYLSLSYFCCISQWLLLGILWLFITRLTGSSFLVLVFVLGCASSSDFLSGCYPWSPFPHFTPELPN